MKKLIALFLISTQLAYGANEFRAPNGIITPTALVGGTTRNASAVLDINSTTQGLGLPNMTGTQMTAISSPKTGLAVFNTTTNQINVYNGTTWVAAGSGGTVYAADSGTANAYVISPTPAAISYAAGGSYAFLSLNANTGASTLNVSSLGVKAIKNPAGGALVTGDILASQIVVVTYDGTNFQMVSPQGPAVSANTANTLVKRDASGNFAAGTITGSLTGNVTGAVTGTASGNIPNSVGTTKGDTVVFSGSATPVRQAAPADYGKLVPDSGQTNGVRAADYKANNGLEKNYIQYADFENNAITGWSKGTIGTLTNGLPTGTPTFGSGSNANLALTSTATGALDGGFSLSYSSSSATTVGDMFCSSVLPIDVAVQSSQLTLSFDSAVTLNPSNVNQSGTASNSYGIAIYDVTNAGWIGVNSAFGMIGNPNTSVTFQTGASTASIRACIYNVNATAGADIVLFDEFKISRKGIAQGDTITNWVQYTPTFTGMGTTSSVSMYSRRFGDSLEVQGQFDVGTATATQAQMTLGYNGINANVFTSTSKIAGIVGVGQANNPSTTNFQSIYILASNGSNYILFNNSTSTNGYNGTGLNGNTVFTGANFASIHFFVPIQGWSANTSQSSDLDNRLITTTYVLTTGAAVASNAVIKMDTLVTDKTASYSTSTGLFTAPVTGSYILSLFCNSNTMPASTYLMINGVKKTYFFTMATAGYVTSGSTTVPLNQNDTVGFYTDTGGTFGGSGGSGFSITKFPGSPVVQSGDSVNGRYFGSSTAISGTLATITFNTKDYDTHNAYSAGTLKIPAQGKYQFNVAVLTTAAAISANMNAQVNILKNGTVVTSGIFIAGGAVSFIPTNESDQISCALGDLITVQVSSSATTPSIYTPIPLNTYFTWAKTGN